MDKPKILLVDLETSPNLGWTWGKYEQNVLEFEQEKQIIGFACKYLGTSKVHSYMLPDFRGYKPGFSNMDDGQMVRSLWELVNGADIIIAHNGDNFDIRVMNARFIAHGLTPPAPYRTVDTLKVAKKYFRFNSNKLDDLGKFFGLGRKLKHEGFDLWLKCMDGDTAAWKTMRRYNEQDVRLLESIYLKMLPWMTNHPNLAVINEVVDQCPKCLSKQLQRRGWETTNTGKKRRYQCQGCGGWFYGKHQAVLTLS